MEIKVKVLPGGKQVKELHNVKKPIAGFYDFHDPYDEEAFERAKYAWQEAEKKCKTFDVEIVGDKPYPHMAAGIPFYHLLPEAEHTAIIINSKTVKIIK